MRKFSTKAKVAAVLGTGAVIVGSAGVATAFFTSTGSATTSGTVAGAQTNTWSVTFGTASYTAGSAIYPGTSETVPTSIKNTGNGNQGLTSVTVALKTSGSDVADSSGTDIPGCLSSWWSVSIPNVPSTQDLAPNASYAPATQKVTLTLNDSAVDQGACQDANPGFTVTAG